MLMPDLQNPPSALFGIVPKQPTGRWDPLLQRFLPVCETTQTLDQDTAKTYWTTILDALIGALDRKPSVVSTQQGKTVEQPPRKLACVHCKSPNLLLPLLADPDPHTPLLGSLRPGKGLVTCKDCGKTDTKASVSAFSMYEYADLVRDRRARLETLQSWRETLDDLLA
jgi:hypothetical protein